MRENHLVAVAVAAVDVAAADVAAVTFDQGVGNGAAVEGALAVLACEVAGVGILHASSEDLGSCSSPGCQLGGAVEVRVGKRGWQME